MQHIHIRTILETLEQINESTGLAGRTAGAIFKNEQGDTWVFQSLKFYPEQGGKYTPEELTQELQQYNDVKWLNNISSKTGGFGIATFTDQQNNTILVGQYMEKIKPNFTKNYMPNTVFGYSLDIKTSKKNKEKLKPQDLLLSKKINLSIAEIMNQLAESLGTDNTLYHVAHKLSTGHPLPITFQKPEGYTFSGFRDYFCEILQPIALLMGQYTGNAGEAAKKFLNGSFQKTVITFVESVTAGLSDSILTAKDGKYVLISTKGGAGAKASAKNLYDKILQLESTDTGKKFLDNYADEVALIKNIVKFGQNGSPLYLGVKFGIINEDESNQVKLLRNQSPTDISNIDANETLSDRLKEFIKKRKTKTPESTDLYFHVMAAIAEKAAKKVNTETNFSKVASDILNNAGLIQVYTVAKEKGSEWVLEEFNTVYPSDNIKGVYLDAGKTYYSTDIKGNFTFLIDKGEGVPKDKQEEPTSDISPEIRQARAKANVTDIFKGKAASKAGAGREKRS